jgi:tRNA 2-selenouridine synthase
LGIEKIQIDHFMQLGKKIPILDVRSPAEYQHAHIPGAHNVPLFTNEERKIVGTAYKQQSRELAIKMGLDFFGPKMRTIVEGVESVVASTIPPAKQVLVHCWRGGMRSAAIAWLLDLYGFKIYTLANGYKSYRHWIIDSFSHPFSLHVIGGYTGSGKTPILHALKNKGVAIIDLEALACHKGSAFGNIGMPAQPNQEMFENLLGSELRKLMVNSGNGSEPPVWVEDESQRIGAVNVPMAFWHTMQQSPLYFINVSFEDRLKQIIKEYGSLNRDKIANAITRLKKRLGGLETKTAIGHLEHDEMEACFHVLLKYYDKAYRKALDKRLAQQHLLKTIDCDSVNAIFNAEQLITKEIQYNVQ